MKINLKKQKTENIENTGNTEASENTGKTVRKHGKDLNKRFLAKKAEAKEQKADKQISLGRSRRKKKLGPVDILLRLVPALAVLVFVGAAFFLNNATRDSKIPGGGKIYYMDMQTSVPADSSLYRSEDGKVMLRGAGSSEDELTLPIYYDTAEMILPFDVAYYNPRTGYHAKINACSTIVHQKNGQFAAKNDSEQKELDSGFLYNGKDFYIFLEPVTLRFNGYKIELSAMSYVEAVYGQYVVCFDYDSKEVFYEDYRTGVTATANGEDYTVSLINDSYTTNSGDERLLVSGFGNLETIV